MSENRIFIFDFDSTFIQIEALEELAAIALKDHPHRQAIINQMKDITNQGVEGGISFAESLQKRIKLFHANRGHLDTLVRRLRRKISVSITRNKAFFLDNTDRIYIVSGGFHEFIDPIVKPYGISRDHIYANTFKFDEYDNIIGYDENNILAQEDGKVALLKSLRLNGDIYVIGDGYTDYQMREAGLANRFYAFTENIRRNGVIEKADHVTPSFDEFLYENKLPMSISYPKNRIEVLLLENVHSEGIRLLQNEGFNVDYIKSSLDEDELAERISNVWILGLRSKTQVTNKVLAKAERLLAIGAFCIGTDQVDLNECARRGIAVFNAPFSNTRSVVELAIGEIIMLMRGVFAKSMNMHQGVWEKSAQHNFEIRGKKLGIVGYGNIGSQLSVLAEALGMEVHFYDIVEKLSLGNARKCRSLRELLRKVDVVTLHVDGNRANTNLFGEKEFRLMKDGSIFLNLSRGFIVDSAALLKYIQKGKILGAAVDVFQREPKSNDEPFVSELQGLPNVILTPHIGGSTEEAQHNIADFVARKMIDYVNSGDTLNSVNFPNLQLPTLRNAHRLIHIHENKPGMLAQINSILAEREINIVGQYLKTNETIGYVITDIAKKYDQGVIDDLKKIPGTIRLRILY
ncbi:phosphoglycerate dehydrogenase [candidate division KSB1 bacterium]|nr:phosphoglycerate dehydrogenase [candidate division KSB1 bacterium]